VRPDRSGWAEVFELGEGDEADSLELGVSELEILDVGIDRVG